MFIASGFSVVGSSTFQIFIRQTFVRFMYAKPWHVKWKMLGSVFQPIRPANWWSTENKFTACNLVCCRTLMFVRWRARERASSWMNSNVYLFFTKTWKYSPHTFYELPATNDMLSLHNMYYRKISVIASDINMFYFLHPCKLCKQLLFFLSFKN